MWVKSKKECGYSQDCADNNNVERNEVLSEAPSSGLTQVCENIHFWVPAFARQSATKSVDRNDTPEDSSHSLGAWECEWMHTSPIAQSDRIGLEQTSKLTIDTDVSSSYIKYTPRQNEAIRIG